MNEDLIQKGATMMLQGIGCNLLDPNFKETPHRIAKVYKELCNGLMVPPPIIKTFPTKYQGMVIVRPIITVGLCPHHFLPVEYNIAVGYIPTKKVIGLSKIPRLVEWLAHKPALQEDLTKEIVDSITQLLKPQGVICVVKGKHSCMRLRGVKQKSGEMITSHFSGDFEKIAPRNEFNSLILK